MFLKFLILHEMLLFSSEIIDRCVTTHGIWAMDINKG